MTNGSTSGIQHQDKKFSRQNFKIFWYFFSTYRRYFKHFFLLVDRTSIGIECVIIFHRFSLMYAKYFTVYFRRTIKFDARVANLMLFYNDILVCLCAHWSLYETTHWIGPPMPMAALGHRSEEVGQLSRDFLDQWNCVILSLFLRRFLT